MDTALYEKGRKLLEAQLEHHRKGRQLQSLRTKEEADVPAILQRMHELNPRERHPKHSGQPGCIIVPDGFFPLKHLPLFQMRVQSSANDYPIIFRVHSSIN